MGNDKDYIIKIQDLDVGDLVTFCGYNYTPDFIIYDAARDGALGIVVEKMPTVNSSTTTGTLFRTYKIFWFNNRKTTTEIRDHLQLTTKEGTIV